MTRRGRFFVLGICAGVTGGLKVRAACALGVLGFAYGGQLRFRTRAQVGHHNASEIHVTLGAWRADCLVRLRVFRSLAPAAGFALCHTTEPVRKNAIAARLGYRVRWLLGASGGWCRSVDAPCPFFRFGGLRWGHWGVEGASCLCFVGARFCLWRAVTLSNWRAGGASQRF